MGFFQDLKNKIKIRRQYRTIFCPFFDNVDKEILKPSLIESNIPIEVANIYEKIRTVKSKRYNNAIHKYDSFYETILKHNNDVDRLSKGMIGFNKLEILSDPKAYDFLKIEGYYRVAVDLEGYKDLNIKQLAFKEDAVLIYKNFDLIVKQKKLYDDKQCIFKKVNNTNNYLDNEFVRPLASIDKQINNELKKYDKFFYDFDVYDSIEELVKSHNDFFVKNNKLNPLFDNVNGRSLDDEQRESVITDELSTLVVAGAGSGKTLTICGKVEYLLKEKNIKPDDILLLSYSKKSADDLQLKVSLIDKNLTVGTFHKIGLEILKETQNKVFMVEDQYKAIIEKYFRIEMKNRPHMLQTILTYYGLYISSDKHDKKYKNEGEMFEDLKKQDFSTLRNQLLGLSNDINQRETIKKEHVKSFEEMAIANWYFINGIDYVYESPYVIDVSTVDKRQYMPDFYLPEFNIYHEHYGINKDGRAEQFEDNEAQIYVANMEWKRSIHTKYQTKCLETYSYEFDDGTVFKKLEMQLKENNVIFRPLSDNEIFSALESIYEGQAFKSFINLIRTFLSLYKARYRDDSGFDELMSFRFKNTYERRRADLFLTIVKDVYHYYLDYIRKEGKIDFDDMILQSTIDIDKCDNFKYKYIIVDEFQDISLSRMLFLKKLISHGHSKLFSVGDDWQAIYRFSGCDLNIFLKFADYFGVSAITKITTTHRNSQELQDIAGPFIKSNPDQFNKIIKSAKHLEHPVRIIYYSDKKYYAFLDILREINKIDNKANVLILGRNNKDIESISLDNRIYIDFKESKETKTIVKVREFPNMKFSYSTVHGSKGLEEDYVIIINADDSRFGFPNKVEDDELLDMVLSSKSNYEYAEERRLWYVALTRTRNYTYIIANNANPSIFVKEIENKCLVMNPSIEVNEDGEISCPYCKSGRLVLRTNESEGSKFYGCSNYPYCRYSIDDFKAVKRNKRCKECGDFLIYKKGQWGAFFGCHNYPRCCCTEKYVPGE